MLPAELLQLTIDTAVQLTDLQCAIKFRETCRQFDQVVQNSIFRLSKSVLVKRRLSMPLRCRLVDAKMRLGNADELPLCYDINRTADYLVDCGTAVARRQYVHFLTTAAANSLMYWKLLDCLTERQTGPTLEQVRDNALVAAVGVEDLAIVRMLLEQGANPASNTPLFGEPLATAASTGSLAVVHLLLDYWDWEQYPELVGLRLMNAIEVASGGVLAKLLDHRDRVARSTFDDAVIRLAKSGQTVAVDRLLAFRQADPSPEAKAAFWLRLVRTAAEYNQQALLRAVLARHLPDIGEASLVAATQEVCLANHSQMVHIILAHLSVSDPKRIADSLFWAAWHGNIDVLEPLLAFLQNDQRALLLACAGAVSGKASEAVQHLLRVAGVSSSSEDIPTRFTDIANSILSDTISCLMAETTEPLPVSVHIKNLRVAAKAGGLVDVIRISNSIKAHYPNTTSGISGAFSDAAKNNHPDVLLFLCENWRPHLVTSCVKSPAVAQIFIDFGWDVHGADQGSKYPRLGSFVHDERFIRWLLDKGVRADARGEWDITAVSVAIVSASAPTIRLLLRHSSSIQSGQLLHFAVQRKDSQSIQIVELLLNLGCPIDSIWFRDDPRSWLEWGIGEAGTALFAAAEQGKVEIVKYLLSRGANAALPSSKGRTALHVAESKQRSEVIQILDQ
ncbi:hypothetical protein OPT61_g7046 [Boeremia exigua]|uniref:Uncharacterized protein n=1 Tax=Boeremia exigua TaxID=749465 RepID=A0ACC2I4V5_9PLEO|nr:hypothetical protein OPT61_g7046 [Boeremia exigua]